MGARQVVYGAPQGLPQARSPQMEDSGGGGGRGQAGVRAWGGAVTEKCREARAQGPLREKLRLRNRRGQVKATQL